MRLNLDNFTLNHYIVLCLLVLLFMLFLSGCDNQGPRYETTIVVDTTANDITPQDFNSPVGVWLFTDVNYLKFNADGTWSGHQVGYDDPFTEGTWVMEINDFGIEYFVMTEPTCSYLEGRYLFKKEALHLHLFMYDEECRGREFIAGTLFRYFGNDFNPTNPTSKMGYTNFTNLTQVFTNE